LQRVGLPGRTDLLLPIGDQNVALIQRTVTDNPLYQGALAGTVLAQQGMHGTGTHRQRDLIRSTEVAERLAGANDLQADRCHAQPSISRLSSALESATAPKTPPCIFTICNAASWLPLSVAAQQSSSRRHSKPRSLASRMVVWTQTSVVSPQRIRLSMPRVRSTSSRSVAQNEPLPGLSMMTSPSSGCSLGMISQPGSLRTGLGAQGAGSPIPDPMRCERQSLLAGRSDRSGMCPSRVWMMWYPSSRMACRTRPLGAIGARTCARS